MYTTALRPSRKDETYVSELSRCEMIIAGMGELNHAPIARHDDTPGNLAECADAAVSPPLRWQIMSQSLDFRRANCEAQLIVIAPC